MQQKEPLTKRSLRSNSQTQAKKAAMQQSPVTIQTKKKLDIFNYTKKKWDTFNVNSVKIQWWNCKGWLRNNGPIRSDKLRNYISFFSETWSQRDILIPNNQNYTIFQINAKKLSKIGRPMVIKRPITTELLFQDDNVILLRIKNL